MKRGRATVGILLGVAVFAIFAANVERRAFLGDDSFISFRYAKHLTEGQGLVWNPGERVEGYTNFLWVLLMAGGLTASVEPDGSLRFTSGRQRMYEWRIGFPFPMIFAGVAEVHERYDDELERFELEVSITNRRFGKIFGYRGWFVGGLEACDGVPGDARPVREEARE